MTKHREFFETMARGDDPIMLCPDAGETCGHCAQLILFSTVAREMLQAEDYDMKKWNETWQTRWRESKFVKLWQEEEAAGRDPHKAFEARGWQP